MLQRLVHFLKQMPFFNGCCELAVEFYRQALSAEVEMMMRFKESPEPSPPGRLPAGFENKIRRASLRVGAATLMASDGCFADQKGFKGFSPSLSVATAAEADRVFAVLADGGQVRMPLGKTFWSPRFRRVDDRFGVGWMISPPPVDPSEES